MDEHTVSGSVSGTINREVVNEVDTTLRRAPDQATILEIGRHWGKLAAAKGLTRNQVFDALGEYFGGAVASR